jgi:large repetitive protein
MLRSGRSKPRAAAGRAVLALQTLEGREVPAGNVAASFSAAGVLTLIGDNAGNDVTLRVTGTTLTITGNAGTTINGRTSVSAFAAVRAVQATLNEGDDALRINPTANFFVPGSVGINLGSGNNTLSLATAGRLTLGSLGVSAGAGNDTIIVAGGARTGSAINGNVSIGTGFGANAVALGRIVVGGAVSVATGDGADTLTIGASTFLNTFTANLGAGNDTIRIAQATTAVSPVDFRGLVTIHAGAGNDTLLLGRAVTAGGGANSRVIFHGGLIAGDAAGTFNHSDFITAQRTGPVTLIGWA